MKSPINIPISKLHPFRGHPYQVRDDDEMDALIESIQEQGILTPLIVRPLENTEDEYEIISGHRRLHAARKAGITEIPVFVYALDRDAAAIALVDSNLHREHILPSEKAFAYKLKYEAMRHQGTSRQVGTKLRTDAEIAESADESARNIQRYIRLTRLIPELLTLVDEGRISLTPAVELSFLPEEIQYDLAEAIVCQDCTPSLSQSIQMKKLSQTGELDLDRMLRILAQPKPNQAEKVSFKTDDIRRFFPKGYTPERMQETIIRLLTDYDRQRRRGLER